MDHGRTQQPLKTVTTESEPEWDFIGVDKIPWEVKDRQKICDLFNMNNKEQVMGKPLLVQV